MAIQVGQRLGPYEILSAIGAGGMGGVYRARDTRLDRTVAIKILSDHLADRVELRERFEREARTIASLNHTHICTLYDVGHQNGTDYLVMEYLEGETLAERLKKGPLPLKQVLQYAIEISDALDKAHRKGITHRDLKPGNILLTKSGAKLLDFGLAKLKQEASPVAPMSQLPTADSAMTAEGTILGTLQYMAPEQVEGKTNEVDARTDIFAFGAVLYEMATGKKAFEGKTQASLIAKILETDPPPMVSLQPMTPSALDHIVKTCLAKEPDNRWQAATDLCRELKWLGECQTRSDPPMHVSERNRKRGQILVWVGATVACAIAGFTAWALKPEPSKSVTRFTISLPAGQQLADLDNLALALSPDGTRLAYVAMSNGGTQQLYLRVMDSSEAKAIPGTEGAAAPFFSPDSQWVGFFAANKLKKIPVTGGEAITLCDAGSNKPYTATWSPDDTIVFHYGYTSGLWTVSAGGGNPKRLITPSSGEAAVISPDMLPTGKAVLFAGGTSQTNLQVGVGSQAVEKHYLIGGTRPTYASTGHLVYAQAGTLMAVPFDPQHLRLTGSAVPVLEGVLQSTTTGISQYSLSKSGSIAYVAGNFQSIRRKLVWVDRKGSEQPLPAPEHAYRNPRISPDGKRLAFGLADSLPGNIWLYDVARETSSRLSFIGGNTPIWTPDGKQVAFQTQGPFGIFWQAADGSGTAAPLSTSQYQLAPGSVSPDGQVLAFMEINPVTGRDLWTMSVKGDRKPQLFLRTQFNEAEPHFSPDGHWIAYSSDESGRYEIYVQPFPGPGGKYQISTDGGTEAVWGRNGEIFYRNGDKTIAVETTTQPTFSAGKPKVLFESPYVPSLQTAPNYDVTADGQRFVMVKEGEQASTTTQINVVLNWFEELKQKVPTGKR